MADPEKMTEIMQQLQDNGLIDHPAFRNDTIKHRADLIDRQREEIVRLREALKMTEGHLEEMRKDEKWHPVGDCPVLNMVRSALSDTREKE